MMLFNDSAADSQPQSSPSLVPCVGGIDLLKAIENQIELIRRNTATLIANGHRQVRGDRSQGRFRPKYLGLNPDMASNGGELNGITEEVKSEGDRPYSGMNITGATGLTNAQREILKQWGAVDYV